MSAEDRGAGPQIGQTVLYNNSGTIVPAIIYAVAASGAVSLVHFASGTANNVASSVNGGGNFVSGTWIYPQFM